MLVWKQFNRELEEAVEQITSSLRGVDSQGKKNINKTAVEALFVLLDQVSDMLQHEGAVDKRFVALMFYLYGQIHAEARFTDYPDPLFLLAGDIESYVDRLFGRCFD